MSKDLSWRLQKLKERQERSHRQLLQQLQQQSTGNRNSDSNIDYGEPSVDARNLQYLNNPEAADLVITYTNPNPVCKYSPLYGSDISSSNHPKFARRHSDFSSGNTSSRNSVYSNGSQGSKDGSNYSNQPAFLSLINLQQSSNKRKSSTQKLQGQEHIQMIPRKHTKLDDPPIVFY